MAWQDVMIPMLRVLINDMETTPVYSDDNLTQVLLVAAIYTQMDIDFDNQYTIDYIAQTISPDPTLNADFSTMGNQAFTNFVVMKGACQADFSTYRTKALMDGITARCGPTSLQVVGNLRGFRELLTIGPCAAYEAMKNDYVFGNGLVCRAIMSPFIGNGFDPESLSVGFNDSRNTYYT